ncbi:MAG: hypothetical protein GY845_25815 [Planctomycetes bacterium]|nr:hypothetical protein [Planctomycetota bacterium]
MTFDEVKTVMDNYKGVSGNTQNKIYPRRTLYKSKINPDLMFIIMWATNSGKLFTFGVRLKKYGLMTEAVFDFIRIERDAFVLYLDTDIVAFIYNH